MDRKVVITGANGFIGKNLSVALERTGEEVAAIDVDSPAGALKHAVSGSSLVFHLAGVNRPEHDAEFATGNVGSLDELFAALDSIPADERIQGPPTIVLSSSTQAAQDNPYGRSKRAAERALEAYASRTAAPAVIYRLPGVFGKWCRPNYNSVVATFCHNIARDLPIAISDPSRSIELVHVDDVVTQFMTHLDSPGEGVVARTVEPSFTTTLGRLADTLRGFRDSRQTLLLPDTSDPFTRRLFGTYVSYVPPNQAGYPLLQRTDARGTLAELLKSDRSGQMFVSRTRPGVTRGNHYHDQKVEKFCVLEGDAVIRFRPILGDEVTEHRVSGRDFVVVDIPPGVTHNISNVGSTEMIVLFWASEIFDSSQPDTHALEVSGD